MAFLLFLKIFVINLKTNIGLQIKCHGFESNWLVVKIKTAAAGCYTHSESNWNLPMPGRWQISFLSERQCEWQRIKHILQLWHNQRVSHDITHAIQQGQQTNHRQSPELSMLFNFIEIKLHYPYQYGVFLSIQLKSSAGWNRQLHAENKYSDNTKFTSSCRVEVYRLN